MTWRLADAKNRFSELVTRALTEGPQQVFRREDAAVVIAQREYDRLTGKRATFKDFLLQTGPDLKGVPLERDRSAMRNLKI